MRYQAGVVANQQEKPLMSGYLQLDDLLRGLSAEGNKVSTGVFTLDLDTAMKKLARFQMASPYHYCLRWLQAAVAGGATYFNWRSSANWVSAEMEGFTIDPAHFPRLPTLLLEPQASRAEQHLSAGLNAALLTRARCIRLRSGNYEGIWKPGNFCVERREMGLQATKIEMERHSGLWRNLWTRSSPGGRDHEQQLLHHQAACAPLSLGIQGYAPDRLIPELAFAYGKSIKPARHHAAPERAGFWAPPLSRSQRFPERCSLYLIRRHGPSFLYPVLDGVLLRPRELKGKAGQAILADASHLKTDLTGLELIEDEDYKRFIKSFSGKLP